MARFNPGIVRATTDLEVSTPRGGSAIVALAAVMLEGTRTIHVMAAGAGRVSAYVVTHTPDTSGGFGFNSGYTYGAKVYETLPLALLAVARDHGMRADG